MPLKIYRASAGSGKTFHLTRTYLTICLQSENPYYFKKILALTFTNKATDEMKNRILEEFRLLAYQPDKSPHLSAIMETTGRSKDDITELSKRILRAILLHYHQFSVSTIDSFLQRLTRLFMREINLPSGYEIELNTDLLINSAMDDLYADLSKDDPLLPWIERIVEQRMLEGKSFHFHNELTKLARELFREDGYEAHYRDAPGNEQLVALEQSLKQEKYKLGNAYEKRRDQIIDILDKHELGPNDFSYKSRGFVAAFVNRDKQNYHELTDHSFFQKAPDNLNNWFPKKQLEGDFRPRAEAIYNEMNSEIVALREFVNDTAPRFIALDKILSNFHSFAVLVYIKRGIERYCHNHNKMLLFQTTRLLQETLVASDTPFLYERMGNRYDHILIDEFQDTSRMQWQAIRPMVEESLAVGEDSLIVGDVKQAIYRWRNGDWKLLHQSIEEQFGDRAQTTTLDENWRSRPFVVEFNNSFYPGQGKRLTEKFEEECEEARVDLEEIPYAEQIYNAERTRQKVARNYTNDGYVSARFYGKDADMDDFWNDLRNTILYLYEKGYRKEHIAILFRKRKEGLQIANKLLEWQSSEEGGDRRFQFISEESLALVNSPVIQVIIALFQLAIDHEEIAARSELWRGLQRLDKEPLPTYDQLDEDDILDQINTRIPALIKEGGKQSLFDFANNIVDSLDLLDRRTNEFAFFQRFQDLLLEYSQKEGNRLDTFLEYWEDEGFETSIQIPEHAQAIRLMSVHKAKGLGFSVVFIPFASWDMNARDTTLWSDTSDFSGEDIPFLPINYSSVLKDSPLKEDYFRERLLSYIDELNVLYVATTRAKERLYMYVPDDSKFSEESNAKNLKTGDLLYDFSKAQGTSQEIADRAIEWYTWGSWTFNHEQDDQVEGDYESLRHYSVHSKRPPIRTHRLPETLAGVDERDQDAMGRGRLIHYFLAEMADREASEEVIQQAVMEGRISLEHREAWREYLEEILAEEPVRSWFAPGQKAFVERDILTADGSMYRPDRVILRNGNTLVIDFKSGTEQPQYRHQLEQYKRLLQSMGYDNVSAHIYYTDEKKHHKISK